MSDRDDTRGRGGHRDDESGLGELATGGEGGVGGEGIGTKEGARGGAFDPNNTFTDAGGPPHESGQPTNYGANTPEAGQAPRANTPEAGQEPNYGAGTPEAGQPTDDRFDPQVADILATGSTPSNAAPTDRTQAL